MDEKRKKESRMKNYSKHLVLLSSFVVKPRRKFARVFYVLCALILSVIFYRTYLTVEPQTLKAPSLANKPTKR